MTYSDQMALVYRCRRCQHVWLDVWDGEVDGDCPECGTTYTPLMSFDAEELFAEANKNRPTGKAVPRG